MSHLVLKSRNFALYCIGFFNYRGYMLAACDRHVVLVASVYYFLLLLLLLFIIQLLMPKLHDKLHDWAARENDEILSSIWAFVNANFARVAPILQQTRSPFIVDSPKFGGQIRDDPFGKQEVNTRTSKER